MKERQWGEIKQFVPITKMGVIHSTVDQTDYLFNFTDINFNKSPGFKQVYGEQIWLTLKVEFTLMLDKKIDMIVAKEITVEDLDIEDIKKLKLEWEQNQREAQKALKQKEFEKRNKIRKQELISKKKTEDEIMERISKQNKRLISSEAVVASPGSKKLKPTLILGETGESWRRGHVPDIYKQNNVKRELCKSCGQPIDTSFLVSKCGCTQ